MNITPELLNNIMIYAIPLGMFGFVKVMILLRDVMAMKMGKVKALVTTENGQLKEKWIKPNSGQVKTKEGTSTFNFDVGYIWRKGFYPVTVVDGKNMMQVNLLGENRDDTTAKDASILIERSYNVGYMDGFKKNKMLNNLIFLILLACVASAIAGILGYQQNTAIINMLKAG